MRILDAFFTKKEKTGEKFEFFKRGKSYLVAYGREGQLVAYTTGISAGDKIMERYIEDKGLDRKDIIVQEEIHKASDRLITEYGDMQICIVDKTLMLKKDVKKLMESTTLIPDKTNRWMSGLDKYTKEQQI